MEQKQCKACKILKLHCNTFIHHHNIFLRDRKLFLEFLKFVKSTLIGVNKIFVDFIKSSFICVCKFFVNSFKFAKDIFNLLIGERENMYATEPCRNPRTMI